MARRLNHPSGMETDPDYPLLRLALGVVWGVLFGGAVRYSNQNYEIIKATLDGAATGAPHGPTILLLTVLSLLLFLIIFLIGVIAWRKSQGFWALMKGTVLGVILEGMLHALT